MKELNAVALVFIAVMLTSGCTQQGQNIQYAEQAFFCPEDSCAEELAYRFSNAGESIDIAVYSFTLDSLADELIKAGQRGVKVRVIIDELQASNKFSEDERLAANGIRVKAVDKGQASMHNKFAIIDGKAVGTGSFNYSRNADEENDENLVFLSNPETVQRYAEEFEEIWNEN